MAFPNLTPRVDPEQEGGTSEMWAEAEGLPDDGDNVIGLPFLAEGVLPDTIDEDWLEIWVQPLGTSITAASFVSLAPDKQSMTVNFTQGGADLARVTVKAIHTLER